MDRQEFKKMVLDRAWNNFYLYADTFNMAEGENVHHKCNFCEYTTSRCRLIDMEVIDNEIVLHLWRHHNGRSMKLAYEIRSKEIANTPGQTRLG